MLGTLISSCFGFTWCLVAIAFKLVVLFGVGCFVACFDLLVLWLTWGVVIVSLRVDC